MQAIIQGHVLAPRLSRMSIILRGLAWSLGIEIEIKVTKRIIRESIRYRISGELNRLKLFESITNQMFDCDPIYLNNHTISNAKFQLSEKRIDK